MFIHAKFGQTYSIQRTQWADSPYDAVIYGFIDDVKNHEHYQLAKAGDYQQAVLLAESFLNEQLVQNLVHHYNNPIILPITAEEKQGKNAIPLGMADVINRVTGWKVSENIYQINKAGHTGANGWHRITTPAIFKGEIVLGAEYLILDDFIGMGGTLANIKSFIENAGAKVIGFQVLTGKKESSHLYLRSDTLENLRKKHGIFEKEFQEIVQFNYTGLTESEAQYLLRAKTIERIRNQITRALRENQCSKDK
ncbi:MAG: hypothetical protein KAH77_07385 [Thiomargarita sp.]|nr:hypothetical protein [Thiomargarita sp.]